MPEVYVPRRLVISAIPAIALLKFVGTHLASEAGTMVFNFGSKHQSKHKQARRFSGALLGTGALLALAGCGGSGNGNGPGGSPTPTPTPVNTDAANSALTPVKLVALTSDNRLLSFNSRTPSLATSATVAGLTAGDTLRAIDFRFPAGLPGNGLTGLYTIGQNGTSQQLYRLDFTATTASAARIGARFDLLPASPAANAFGFDFNPTVDRIRLIEPTSNRDLRLNPNVEVTTSPVVDGDPATAGVQGDGPIAYADGDANFGQDPDAVGAAYLNPDADPNTGTVLYVLDAARNTLAIQGRAADPATGVTAISPNSGTLFTVGTLSIDVTSDTGFDISPTANAAFVSNGARIFGIAVAPGAGRGATTGGASLNVPSGTRIIGLAATS